MTLGGCELERQKGGDNVHYPMDNGWIGTALASIVYSK